MYVQISRATDYAFRIHMCIARSKRERERKQSKKDDIEKDRGRERGKKQKVREREIESCRQCDQIGRFIGVWATFQSLWQQLICPNLPHS